MGRHHKETVVVDVWGDEEEELLARFCLPLPLALAKAKRELMAGYMVNLKEGLFLDAEFDRRLPIM